MTEAQALPIATPGPDALDDEQRAAVTHDRGPLLIVAGAGTGKTTVIVRRIAHLIESGRARPNEILALAFNEKAAAEMQERVDQVVPYGYADVHIATFHAFGQEVLTGFGMQIGIAPGFTVLDKAGQAMFLAEHLDELELRRYAPLSHPTKYLEDLAGFFNRAKDEPVWPERMRAHAEGLLAGAGATGGGDGGSPDAAARDDGERLLELADAYGRYNRVLWKNGFLDFGDLLALTHRLFEESPAALRHWQERYRYILVDEFQDTNPVQFRIVRRLAEAHRNLAVVGDDDQSIYRFRGAHLQNILTFEEAYPDAARIVLRRNYRSTREVLRVARRLIVENRDRLETRRGISKELLSERSGPEPRVREFANDAEEADAVAREIEEALSSGRRRCRDIAILVRNNNHAEPFLRALDARGVPYYFSGSRGLFRRPEVKVLIACLHSIYQETRQEYLYLLARDGYGVPEDDLAKLTHALAVEPGRFRALLRRAAAGQAGGLEISEEARTALERLLADLDELRAFARDHRTGEALYHFLERRGILRELAASRNFEDEVRARNIVKFFSIIRSFEAVAVLDRVPLFLRHLDALVEHGDDPAVAELDVEADVVQVLTIHKAKGLEFPCVYLVQAASDRFPTRNRAQALPLPAALTSGEHDDRTLHKEEERRLCYVALTRAKEELTATYAVHYAGTTRARKPSEFLAEAFDLPKPVPAKRKRGIVEELEKHRPGGEEPKATPPPGPREPVLLSSRRLEDYDTCPLKYRFLHLLSVESILTRDPRVNFGHAVHQAVGFALNERRHGATPAEERVIEVFRANWRNEGYRSEEHARRRFEQGVEALRAFLEREAREPVASDVERSFRVKMGDVLLSGRMDRVDEEPDGTVIADYKTSELDRDDGADDNARDNLQLRVYALAHRELTGRAPKRVELRYVLSGVRGAATLSDEVIERTRDKVLGIAGEIRAGNFAAKPSERSCAICACRLLCKESAV